MDSSEREAALRLLKEILAIPSVNGKDDEGAVARYLCAVFEKAGISASLQKIDALHSNVIAVLDGANSSDSAIWNGHLDTVPYGDRAAWETDPAVPVERDGFVYGRGASDMKSGLAAMVFALCSFASSGRRPARRTVFLGTCDEERNGIGASAILRDQLLPPCSTLLIGEPTGNNFGVAQKGCYWMQILAEGKTSHGAYPEQGCNAVEHGVALADALKAHLQTYRHPILGGATAQITKIEGGVAPNMTPDRCSLLMDIRTVPDISRDRLMTLASTLAEKETACYHKMGLNLHISLLNDRPSIEISKGHPMLLRLQEAAEKYCGGGKPVGISFFTDASILVKDRPETAVLLFGPGEPELAHKPNEAVRIEKYFQAISVYKDLLA
ncbi:peptidase M20A family protein [Oscillibacter valericigenes Sjm18-20]|nr:peptidase M20A family protein [Oscillibacter valericigenes Sjm18-20]